ncbi:MAG: glycerate kinase [Chthoniobacterales bacterium]|nr:glycerate kinase [Chthoniobacterales bacterium]
MRILVASDKFKGSLTATGAGAKIAEGIREGMPEAEITVLPVADGGEGTAEVFCRARRGVWARCDVKDANGARVSARYCITTVPFCAVVETSDALGLWRIAPDERDPDAASSFGVGEMLLDAAGRGVRQIIVGLGGSATNDGGVGMARALGFRFLDSRGSELSGRVSELLRVINIEVPSGLSLPPIIAASDVGNPLLGPRGATHLFSRQKGAHGEQREVLESALARLADVVATELGVDLRKEPGGGAAGGLGFGLVSFCGATIRSGFDVVAEAVGLASAIKGADIVVTGEGRLDSQTQEGKAPAGVARLARAAGKRVYALVGSATAGEDMFDAVLTLMRPGITSVDAMSRAGELLRERAKELTSLLRRS